MTLNSVLFPAQMLAEMNRELTFPIKIFAIVGLIALIGVGIYFFINEMKYFGRDPETPSDTSGGRDYGRVQTWMCYWGLVIVFAFFAIIL